MTRIIVTGASGRMGDTILGLLSAHPNATIAGAVEHASSPALGSTIHNVVITDKISDLLSDADVIIDFTRPDASVGHAVYAAETKTPIVIGTTGLSDAQMDEIQNAGRHTAVVYSPNTSVGVNLFWHVAGQLAGITRDDYTMSIEETHHVHKVDAPSGTAKRLHSVAAAAANVPGESIPMVSHREGEVVGDHSITFDSNGDTITLTHHAKDRAIFAQGAITAALWAAQQPAGYYGMGDVLGIS